MMTEQEAWLEIKRRLEDPSIKKLEGLCDWVKELQYKDGCINANVRVLMDGKLRDYRFEKLIHSSLFFPLEDKASRIQLCIQFAKEAADSEPNKAGMIPADANPSLS